MHVYIRAARLSISFNLSSIGHLSAITFRRRAITLSIFANFPPGLPSNRRHGALPPSLLLTGLSAFQAGIPNHPFRHRICQPTCNQPFPVSWLPARPATRDDMHARPSPSHLLPPSASAALIPPLMRSRLPPRRTTVLTRSDHPHSVSDVGLNLVSRQDLR